MEASMMAVVDVGGHIRESAPHGVAAHGGNTPLQRLRNRNHSALREWFHSALRERFEVALELVAMRVI